MRNSLFGMSCIASAIMLAADTATSSGGTDTAAKQSEHAKRLAETYKDSIQPGFATGAKNTALREVRERAMQFYAFAKNVANANRLFEGVTDPRKVHDIVTGAMKDPAIAKAWSDSLAKEVSTIVNVVGILNDDSIRLPGGETPKAGLRFYLAGAESNRELVGKFANQVK